MENEKSSTDVQDISVPGCSSNLDSTSEESVAKNSVESQYCVVSKSISKKRESWETEETKYFLRLIKERQVMKSLDTKKFRADDIFKHLESFMAEKGYNKNWKQMQTRFKTLRHQYNDIRRKMNKSGSGNYLSNFPYASEMADLLDSRPISVQNNIDSSLSQESRMENEKSSTDVEDVSVLGYSTNLDSTSEESVVENSLTKSSKTTNIKKEKSRKRTYDSALTKYADKINKNYEEIQAKTMKKTQDYVRNLVESDQKVQKEIVDNMLQSQRNILQDTTNQFLNGLRDIFQNANPIHNQVISTPLNNLMNPQFFNSSISSLRPHIETFRPSNTAPKVIVNLKPCVNEQENTIKLQKIDNKVYSSTNSNSHE